MFLSNVQLLIEEHRITYTESATGAHITVRRLKHIQYDIKKNFSIMTQIIMNTAWHVQYSL